MRTIYTVGETTYDIVFKNNQPSYAVVGGSSLNSSVSLGRIGLPVHFISCLGNDKIGDLSINFLCKNGVNCNHIVRFDGNSRVSLAFLDDKNNAEYQFYKTQQSPRQIFPEPKGEDLILFGSTNAIQDEGRNEMLLFLKKAKDKKTLTIYDPNIRESEKSKLIKIREKVAENYQYTQILKGSDQDFYRLYETSDADEIFSKINPFGIKVLIVTAGEKPVQLRTNEISKTYSFKPVKPISTIGAGDNFTAGIIAGFYNQNITIQNLNQIQEMDWDKIIKMGNSFASEVCQSKNNYISPQFASGFSEQFLKS